MVCMDVCMYVCVYIYMYVYIYILYIYIYTYNTYVCIEIYRRKDLVAKLISTLEDGLGRESKKGMVIPAAQEPATVPC